VLRELSGAEQHYQAVLAVIEDGLGSPRRRPRQERAGRRCMPGCPAMPKAGSTLGRFSWCSSPIDARTSASCSTSSVATRPGSRAHSGVSALRCGQNVPATPALRPTAFRRGGLWNVGLCEPEVRVVGAVWAYIQAWAGGFTATVGAPAVPFLLVGGTRRLPDTYDSPGRWRGTGRLGVPPESRFPHGPAGQPTVARRDPQKSCPTGSVW